LDGKSRIDKLKSLLGERILVIDGAVGTAIQDLNLGPEDFGGPEFEGCNEYLVLTRPELIATIHQSYLDWKPTPSAPLPWYWRSTIWLTKPAASTGKRRRSPGD